MHTSFNVLLQQMKEKEERDDANAKKIKECEEVIKTEEDSIKLSQVHKKKLRDEINRKLFESSNHETTNEILQQKKLIWVNLLEKTRQSLNEEETKLDALQQKVCLNRISFCDNTREFLDKHDLLEMSCGFVNKHVGLPQSIASRQIKSEEDVDEYNSFSEKIRSLENQLEELKAEEAQIEDSKQLKVQLQAEPSCGENFLRYQNSLNDLRDDIKKLELQIETVKNNISQKELQLLNKRKLSDFQPSHDFHQHFRNEPKSKKVTSIQNIGNKVLESRVVTFQESVDMKPISPLPQLKSILKSRALTAKSPSPSLRKKLSQQISSKLDEELKEILF